MANDITNISGTQIGTQKLGSFTVQTAGGVVTKNPSDQSLGSAGHIGSFESEAALNIADIDDKYDTRFDNVSNIFNVIEGAGTATTGTFYADGLWGLYRNTLDDSLVIAANQAGVIKTVALS